MYRVKVKANRLLVLEIFIMGFSVIDAPKTILDEVKDHSAEFTLRNSRLLRSRYRWNSDSMVPRLIS